MFTIKYRTYPMAAAQSSDGPLNYDECEQIHGPFGLISQEMVDGYKVVYAHRGEEMLGMTFGPCKMPETAGEKPPRPIVWVMNEHGATVAKYEL